jgi:uncharacterized protein YxjI
MELTALQAQNTFLVRQKITAFVNRYVISVPTAEGTEGEMVAFVEQKRLAFREEVTFFADEAKTQPLFKFKARQVLDIGATYDVTELDGRSIGLFRKDFKKSLLRSTWHLEQPGVLEATGQERSLAVAILRRVQDTIPLPFHFDFVAADGHPVMSLTRKMTLALRDKYLLEVHDPVLDRRLAIAMAVALDALQSR